MPENKFEIIWAEYLKYRAKLRGYEISVLEEVIRYSTERYIDSSTGRNVVVIRYSTERYIDSSTGRNVVVGKHDNRLVMIPYECDENRITPVTVHATSRQQIKFRLKTGRFTHG